MPKPKKGIAKTDEKDDEDDDEPEEAAETEVDVPDDDDDDEGGDEKEPASPPKPGETRAAKRRNRYKEAQEAAERARQEAAESTRRAADLEERLRRTEIESAELKGRMSSIQTPDPTASKLDEMSDAANHQLAIADAESATPEQRRAAMRKYQDIVSDMAALKMEARQAQKPKEPSSTQEDYERAALKAEFPLVFGNKRATRWALGMYEQLVADEKPEGLATAREAASMAQRKFNLGGPPPTTAAEQRRYTAPSSRQLASPGEKLSGPVRLNSAQMKMAQARWPEVDDPAELGRLMAKLLRKKGVA